MAKRPPKLSIDNEKLTEEFFGDTRLLGIMTPLSGYQLCLRLNNVLRMEFVLKNDLEIQLKRKKRDYFFPVYEHCEPTGSLAYFIYKNKFDGEYLLPELKHLDFLLLMKGDVVSDKLLQQIIGVIKFINGVQLVMELTNEKIKKKENLVF